MTQLTLTPPMQFEAEFIDELCDALLLARHLQGQPSVSVQPSGQVSLEYGHAQVLVLGPQLGLVHLQRSSTQVHNAAELHALRLEVKAPSPLPLHTWTARELRTELKPVLLLHRAWWWAIPIMLLGDLLLCAALSAEVRRDQAAWVQPTDALAGLLVLTSMTLPVLTARLKVTLARARLSSLTPRRAPRGRS